MPVHPCLPLRFRINVCMHACHKDPKVNRWDKFSAIVGVVWIVFFIIAIVSWVNTMNAVFSNIANIGGGGSSTSSGACCKGSSLIQCGLYTINGQSTCNAMASLGCSWNLEC